MTETIVILTEACYGRTAYLTLKDDKVVFDDSDDEYGPIEFNIEILQEALDTHLMKLSHQEFENWLKKVSPKNQNKK